MKTWTTTLLFCAMTLPACTADTTPLDDEAATDEGALVTNALAGATRVRLEMGGETYDIASRRKVSKIVAAFKKPTGNEVLPRCSIAPSTKIAFFDERGKELATGSYFCFRGTIKPTGRASTRVTFTPGSLDVVNDALVPADVLWEVSKVAIEKKSSPSNVERAEVTDAASITALLGALDVEQEPVLTPAAATACARSWTLTFYRGHDDIAQTTYCASASGNATRAKARLAVVNRHGSSEGELVDEGEIKVDERAIGEVFTRASRE